MIPPRCLGRRLVAKEPEKALSPVPVASGPTMLLAICQGLGLAIAVGLIIGVVVPPIMPAWGAVAGGAPPRGLPAGAAPNGAGEGPLPALPRGGLGAGLAAVVSPPGGPRAGGGQQGGPARPPP